MPEVTQEELDPVGMSRAPSRTGLPRVLHVVEGLGDHVGGLQSAVVAIANVQAKAGHAVSLAAGKRRSEETSGLEPLDHAVKVQRFAYSRLIGRFNGSWPLLRYLWRAVPGADVVHCHSVWSLPSYAAGLIALLRRKRLVLSTHGSLEPYDVRKHGRVKRVLGPVFVRPVLNRAHVLCTSDAEAGGMTRYGARPTMTVLPLPPAPEAAPTVDRSEFLSDARVPPGARVLLFLGRLDPKKGLHHVLDAMPSLPTDVHLVVVGAGDDVYESRLRSAVSAHGIEERVHFIGWLPLDRKADAYRSADLFVLLSHNENYGITPIEAARACLPSLLTEDVYSAEYLVRRGAAELTSRDPHEAARAIEAILSDRSRLDSMRAACRTVFTNELSDESIAAGYSRLLAGALTEAGS